jgi:hypothetical protein
MTDKSFIEGLVEDRAKGTASLKIAWKSAFESFPSLPAELLEPVASTLPSPDTARHFARFLGREADPAAAVRKFLQEVEESDEQLEEWINAFEVLAYFLESTPHRPSLTHALGYLHCCAAVSHTGARYATFPMTVETMLETYGYCGEEAEPA